MPSLTLGALDLMASPYATMVGTSWGAWTSITSTTSSLFLDGSVVSGSATANREIPLQVMVQDATRSDLVAACEALIGEANKPSNTLTFTPDVGSSVVYEVFRAKEPARLDDESSGDAERIYALTFPALPFARSAARETPTAAPVSLFLNDFEAPFNGLMLDSKPQEAGVGGDIWAGVPAQGAAYPGDIILAAFYGTTSMAATMTAVTNATITYPTTVPDGHSPYSPKTAATMAATASGLVEMRSTAAVALGAEDFVTVAVNLGNYGTPTPLAVGIEWLDVSSATIRIDWGVTGGDGDRGGWSRPCWTTSRRPAGATQARARFRLPTATIGQAAKIVEMIVLATAINPAVPVDSRFRHDGSACLPLAMYSGYAYGALSAPVDISAAGQITLWLTGLNGYKMSVRLFDSAGRWTRWTMTPHAAAKNQWTQPTALLSAPDVSCAAGAVDLTQIVAWDVDQYGLGVGGIDSLGVGPLPSATASPRGDVLSLPILGSARSVAQVMISSGSVLTDWLVATVDPTMGEPMLAVTYGTTPVATAAAPAQYGGVYSILGCIYPAAVMANATCTIVQKNAAGVTVATQVLAGTQRPGNRYVDFGAVALPLVAVPADNLGTSYTFTIYPTSVGWVEVLVIDVNASLAWVDNMATALPVGWVDEPDITTGLGQVWVGTATDRSDAIALAAPVTMSRPLQVAAPATNLLVYSTATSPSVTLSYYPRWLVEPS